jgi:VanZ family protein
MLRKNIFSIITAIVIMYLSMASSQTFDEVPKFVFQIPGYDKLVHFLMYFALMSAIIIENRKSLKNTGRFFLIGLIPLSYGIIIEILQSTLTATRSGSVYDALADALGILVSIMIGTFFLKKLQSDRY